MTKKCKTREGGARTHPALGTTAFRVLNGSRHAAQHGDNAPPKSAYQRVFDASPNKIAVFDDRARVEMINCTLEAFLGAGREEIRGKRSSDIFRGEQAHILETAIQNVAASGENAVVEMPIENLDGTASAHVFKLAADVSEPGVPTRVIVYGHDIGDLVELRAAAAESQDQLHAAIATLPDLFWIKDLNGRYVHCNEVFDEFNKVPIGWMLGKTAYDTCRPIDLQAHLESDRKALNSDKPVTFEVTLPSEDGVAENTRYFLVQKMAIRNERGEVTGIVGTARDISESRRLEQEIRRRERHYRQLLDNIPDCILQHDADGKVMFFNKAMVESVENDFGYPFEEFLAKAADNSEVNATFEAARQIVHETISSKKQIIRELEFQSRSGEITTHELRYSPELADDGTVVSVSGISRDVTDKKKAEDALRAKEKELERLAFTDSLTGLANRVRLRETLRDYLDKAVATGSNVALLTLDVDRFKTINDTLGHIVGDELLIQFAQRLKSEIGDRGWLGRLGGDEFVIIMPDIDCRDRAVEISQEIIQAISRPMRIGNNSVNVSTSIGIAIGPDDSPCDQTLFRFSDIALYHAKSSGRNRACCYSEAMSDDAERHFRFETMIREGLRNNEFEAHFQAKVDLSTRRITGAEALCRWRHPERGFIPSGVFIPVAEETGQIVEIGKIILRQACEFAVTCNGLSDAPFTVAVNVSPRQIMFGGFLAVLGTCLEETGCKTEWLELEITESVLLADSDAIQHTLETIADLGILISIDDFGTGYSALSYLRNLPIGGLKVDQSFVRDMNTNEKQNVLVRSVLAMAQGLKLKTVAEGVECEDIARKLAELGCETGQGYLWHRPSNGADFLDLLKTSRGSEAQRKTLSSGRL